MTLASWGGRTLPTDHESFAALCGRLRSPIVAEALAISKPISAIFHRKGMQNIWKHFEKWNGPAGFVAMADAVCAVQPGLCARHDQRVGLFPDSRNADGRNGSQDPNFPAEFFKRQAEFVRQPWDLSVARDRQALGQSDGAEGGMSGEVWERVLREGAGVPVIAEALFNVINLNRPAQSLGTDSNSSRR